MKYRFLIVVAVLFISGGIAAWLFWQQIEPVSQPVPVQASPDAPPAVPTVI